MQDEHVSQQTQQSQERFADELSSPDDYWLTITDAARATRRQEVSIRRWISKGLLPVRKQHVGLNQRTRLVRASDLAALTPIIDPAGAISTERGRLDLTSIPVQQAQIKDAHQHLQVHMTTLQQQVDTHVHTSQQALSEQDAQQKQAIAALTTEMHAQFARQQALLEVHSNDVHSLLIQQEQTFSDKLKNIEAHLSSAQTLFSEKVTSLDVYIAALEEKLVALSTARQRDMEQHQQQLEAISAQLQQEIQVRKQLSDHVAHLEASISSQGEQITHCSQVQERLERPQDRLSTMHRELQEQCGKEMQNCVALTEQQAHFADTLAQLKQNHLHADNVQLRQETSITTLEERLTQHEQQTAMKAEQHVRHLEQTVLEMMNLIEQVQEQVSTFPISSPQPGNDSQSSER
jgi:hypothetical protein